MGRLNASISRAALAALAVVITVAVFSPALQNGFVYDDHTQVLKNPWITDLRYIPDILSSSLWSYSGYTSNTYRPMLHLLFMASYFAFGFKPWGWHLVNIIVHAINALLVFGVASRLLRPSGEETPSGVRAEAPSLLAPFFAALLFALHPVNAEPVAWVSAVTELTFTLFFLLSFYLYMKSREDGRPGLYIISLAFFIPALLSKETAIVLPAIVIAYDLSGGKRRKGWRYWPGFLAVSALYMIVRTLAIGGVIQHRQAPLSGFELVLNIFPLVFQYAEKLVYPSGLSALYELHTIKSLDPAAVAGIAATAAFVAALFVFRKRKAVLSGLLMVGVPLLPVLYIPALSTSASADRYMYLPTAGLSIIIGFMLEAIFKGKLKAVFSVAAVIITIAAATAFAFGSFERVSVWEDDLALWSDTVRKSPGSKYARYNLALAYQAKGDIESAIGEFNAAIKAAPDYEDAHYNLAWCYQLKGDNINATLHYREVLRLDPGSADAHYNLGLIYKGEFLIDEAVAEFSEALRLRPGYAEAAGSLAEISGTVGGAPAR